MASNWSGHPNGQIPDDLGVNFEGTGKYLQADAARQLTRLFDEVEKRSGARPYIAAGQDLYRDLAEQEALLEHNYHVVSSGGTIFYAGKRWAKNAGIDPTTGRAYVTCATPGASNHGVMLAGDISFPTALSRSVFRSICPFYGWTNAGDAFGEDWHKEYHGTTLTPASSNAKPITVQEDVMAIKIYEDAGPTAPGQFTGKFFAGSDGKWVQVNNADYGGDPYVRGILTQAFNTPILMYSGDLAAVGKQYLAS
jgi:hypothetical protein